MAGIFYGLEIARRGLNVSQQAITLTGNNIANVDTEGYTRQRLVIESIYPNPQSRYAPGVTIGGGAEVTNVTQLRSAYIDRQLRDQYAAFGQWNTRSEELQFIESILNETNEEGTLTAAMNDFFSAFSQLTTNADSEEVRTNLQQNAIKLCETLNHYSQQLTDVQESYNNAMGATVDNINSILAGIADYNKQIFSYEMGGQQANELRDSRELLLDRLSQLVDITYSENEEGKLSVKVGGDVLVDHTDVVKLSAVADPSKGGRYSVYLEGTPTLLDFSGGQLQAYQDLRDGNSVDNIGVPYLLSSLDTLSQSLAKEFNAVHETGYTIPYGSSGISQNGVKFFAVPDDDYSKVTAANFSLSQDILDSVYNIAASSKMIDLSAENTQKGNNEVALKLYALTSSTSLDTVGSFQSYLKSFVVQVGIAGSAAQDMSKSQTTIVDNLQTRKEAVSGVSIDEEIMNMISFKYAFAAASRLMTTVDDTLNTLINGTGRVGL